MYQNRLSFLFVLMLCIAFSPVSQAKGLTKTRNIEKLVKHFETKGKDIRPLLEDPRFELVENITGKFTKAVEVKIEDLDDYKGIIKFDRKKDKIFDFYVSYFEELNEAEKQYEIPKEVIIGILGIESEFGRYQGSYNPFSVYVSMYAEEYRSKWALAQLEELLDFAERNSLDVLELKSSYAGAMSYAQFIPWSLNRYWVGTDLYHMPNNIQSVAKYLAHYKQVTGSLEESVLRYNPSSLYQQAVLALADEAKKITSGK